LVNAILFYELRGIAGFQRSRTWRENHTVKEF